VQWHHPVPTLYNLEAAFAVAEAVMDAAGVAFGAYSHHSDIVVVSGVVSVEREMYMLVHG
jgi:hypothetical protein